MGLLKGFLICLGVFALITFLTVLTACFEILGGVWLKLELMAIKPHEGRTMRAQKIKIDPQTIDNVLIVVLQFLVDRDICT